MTNLLHGSSKGFSKIVFNSSFLCKQKYSEIPTFTAAIQKLNTPPPLLQSRDPKENG